MTLAPWSTKKSDAAFLRSVRSARKELRERNPALVRRVSRLSDRELDSLELALLLAMPSSPEANYSIKLITGIQYCRDHPPRKPPEYPAPPISPVAATPAAVPTEMDGERVPRQAPPIPPPTAAPTERAASNVLPFDLRCVPKAFGVGRDVRWIGGEISQWPGDYGK